MEVEFTLLADGGSDRALLPIAKWVFEQHLPTADAVRGEAADLSQLRHRPKTLKDRVIRALEFYPCDFLVVHRDAETQNPEVRYQEIEAACREAQTGSPCSHVCVVPVRMTEAWLLFDELAIRRAAGNPNGVMPLSLPVWARVESVPNPKLILLDALREASGLTGRRRRTFSAETARFQLAQLIDDFSPLRSLTAFSRFEIDVGNAISDFQGHEGPA